MKGDDGPEDGGSNEQPSRFLCDEMLGKLSKWLRLLGYDTKYVKDVEDEDIRKMADTEDRRLLTRDKDLSGRAEGALYIESDDPDIQLVQVFRTFGLSKDRALTLCTICGHVLTEIPKDEARDKVPEKVYELQDEFFYCRRCDKFYWRGSHYDKITDRIDDL